MSGLRNLITDVAGIRVGQAQDDRLKSGVSVVTAAAPFTAGVHVMGGAPATVETDLLAPDRLVQQVDALVLSGGSAFGLAAADGVRSALRAAGRGFAAGTVRVPIVSGAMLFDLTHGGETDWEENPFPRLGSAAVSAAGVEVALGTAGAGTGAVAGSLKGGIGSASQRVGAFTVGALVAVNAMGETTVGAGPHFWAGPFESGAEFGGLGPCPDPAPPWQPDGRMRPRTATTLAVVATDAALSQAQATRMAIAAHDGIARAVVPAHGLIDGDVIFAAATGQRALADPVADQTALGHAGAVCVSRAIARAVFAARPAAGDTVPCWQTRFGPAGGG